MKDKKYCPNCSRYMKGGLFEVRLFKCPLSYKTLNQCSRCLSLNIGISKEEIIKAAKDRVEKAKRDYNSVAK